MTLESMKLQGYSFQFICNIDPNKDSKGKTLLYTPQINYNNSKGISLNEHGIGKFCKFRIPTDLNYRGVYCLKINKEIKYIGECEDLSSRFNSGYGQISPRNCYIGGQSTNCRINKLILKEHKKGDRIELWFFKTINYKIVEKHLIKLLDPPWNNK